MTGKSKQTYSRAEKRAYFIGIGAGGSDERAAREYVRGRCGDDAAVMASFERGVHVGRMNKQPTAPTATRQKSFNTNEFAAAALRRSYGDLYTK